MEQFFSCLWTKLYSDTEKKLFQAFDPFALLSKQIMELNPQFMYTNQKFAEKEFYFLHVFYKL